MKRGIASESTTVIHPICFYRLLVNNTLLLSLLCLFSSQILSAQTQDTSQYAIWRQLVEHHEDCKQYDSLVYIAEQARVYAVENELHELILEFTARQRLALFRVHPGQDSASRIFLPAIPVANQMLEQGDSSLWIARLFIELVDISQFRRERENVKTFLFRAREALPHSMQRPSAIKGRIYTGLAFHYLGLEEMDSTLFYQNQAISQIQEGSEELLHWYKLGANIEMERKNYVQAEQLWLKQLPLAEVLGNMEYVGQIIYYGLAATLRASGDYDKALHYLRQAIGGTRKNNLMANYLIMSGEYETALKFLSVTEGRILHQRGYLLNYLPYTRYQLARVYKEMGKMDSAEAYYDAMLEVPAPVRLSAIDTFAHHRGIAKLRMMKQQYPEAMDHLQEAHDHIPNQTRFTDYFIDIHQQKNEAYIGLNQPREALWEIHQGLHLLLQEDSIHKDLTRFGIERFSNPQDYMALVSAKANTYQYLYEAEHHLELLDSALYLFQYTDRLMDTLQNRFRGDLVKQQLSEKGYTNYLRSVQVCQRLFEATGDDSYLHQAFYFAEKSKSYRLQEAIRESEARQFLAVPDTLLRREQTLLNQIQYQERKRLLLENRAGLDSLNGLPRYWEREREIISRELFRLRRDYQNLIRRFEREYPAYYTQKFDIQTASIDQIQTQCRQNRSGFVEYVVGDSVLFAFVITPSTVHLHRLPIDISLDSTIQTFRNSLYAYWLDDERTEEAYTTNARRYAALGYRLYQQLVEPWIGDMHEVDHFTIVPDASLGYLPFEILLTKHPEVPEQFGQHAYLLREFAISYAFSGSMQMQNRSQTFWKRETGILAIRPTFEEIDQLYADVNARRRDGLGPLAHTEEEVNLLSAQYGAVTLEDRMATKDHVLAELYKNIYAVLHFATHSKSDDQRPQDAKIALTAIKDSSESNDFLSFAEILNLRLDADMVVLSACETGLGEFQKGEGIMSLSRAFAYAGAKSVITTLWSVDDRSTSQLMQNFYERLDQGKYKSIAMQQSKLQYLDQSNDRHAHPFFWAGPVVIGSDDTIQMGAQRWPWGSAILLLILIVVGLLIKNRKPSYTRFKVANENINSHHPTIEES